MTLPAGQIRDAAHLRTARTMHMATPVPRLGERIAALAVPLVFWGATGLYAIAFCLISLQQYNAYIPHALDLGNMAQTFWNTVHGHPFHFQNMRAPIQVEAFGTNTRLSFHVEPIIPFLAIFYAFWQHVETLLVLQTLALASGAIPVRLLARRRLGNPLAELAFPIAYLLFPALEAANLYEFHPVAFAVPLLLWAFYFADARRYTLFTLAAFAAMGCKEELGILVALMGLWIAVRNGDRQFGAIIGVLSLAWSFVAVQVIVPHFHAGPSSYWSRYLPPGYPGVSYPVDQAEVRHFWLHNPNQVIDNLTDEAKRSYLHRLLYPTGYLALFSPLTLLVGVPSLLLIMLSYEPHMYGGLAHYSAELVPVTIVAAILGTEWLSKTVAPRLRIPSSWAVAACCVYVVFAAAINHRDNGFSPLAAGFIYPTITAHDTLINQAIGMIPPNAAVSAQDSLNPHLSDREQVYLYPDTDYGKVQYILLDATQGTGSTMRPCDLVVQVTGMLSACNVAAGPATPQPKQTSRIDGYALLPSHRWNVIFAKDGILLLQRRIRGTPLHNTLPSAFFTFAMPEPGTSPPHTLVARFGNYLELEGYQVDRRERANLRNPDIVLTTWWRVLATPPANTKLIHYLSDPSGALQFFYDDQQTTDWFQPDHWRPGQTYKVQSSQLTVTTNQSGRIDIDIGLTTNDRQYQIIDHNLQVTMLSGPPGAAAVGNGKVLRVASIFAHL